MKALVLRNWIHWDMASPYVHKHRQDIYFLSLQPEICCLQPASSIDAGFFGSTDPSRLIERFGIFIKLISASIIWPCILVPWCADNHGKHGWMLTPHFQSIHSGRRDWMSTEEWFMDRQDGIMEQYREKSLLEFFSSEIVKWQIL